MAGTENNMSIANTDGNNIRPGSSKVSKNDSDAVDVQKRKQLRRSYKNLLEKTANYEDQSLEEIFKNPKEQKKFGKILGRAEKLFPQVVESGTAQEALLDAKCFKQISKLSRSMVDNLSMGSAKFNPMDFAERLSNYGQLQIEMDPRKDSYYVHMPDCQARGNESCDMPACYMKKIGLQVQNILKKPVYIKYLFGSIEREEIPNVIAEKKQRARISTGDGTGLATQTFVDDGKKDAVPDSGASLTEKLVESTMEQLKDAFYTNGRCDMSRNYSNENDDEDYDAIPYFDFILDPTSFGKSVENMFHVSFLIKEGRAKMIVQDDRDDGLPYIRPMKEGKPGAAHHANEDSLDNRNQAILSLDMEEWKEMIELLNITQPMIHHDIDALKKKKYKN